METKTGTIGVTTQNIFPVIKKFLYTDHEIFLRELVSNAVDATQKLRTLATFGKYDKPLGDLDVKVSIDPEAKTLTISDSGIGMTADEIDKYINQIAFSGAEEFLEKYKNTANSIIGHFGLGFYSAFMVADKVEIRTLSYKDDARAVLWQCDGSPEYTLEPTEKSSRGTDIILHISDDSAKFLDRAEIDSLLKKYCRFLPIPIISADKTINATLPLWNQKPADLSDDDYRKFYHDLYPLQDDPLFWIHLNVDYPFKLTGILYFPKIKNDIQLSQNRIQLYSNQVYVTDSVEGVVPEFMTLLQGILDSPDIPLNVSRSQLQSDTAVKKISSYITKKVSDRLLDLFKDDRAAFEQKWDNIKLFIEYGMLTDQKFADSALKFFLLKDSDNKYYTIDEYSELIKPAQTDKDNTTTFIYTTDPLKQYNYIRAAANRGYSVLVLDGQLETHIIGLLENKIPDSKFVRVDSDTIDNLIKNDNQADDRLSTIQRTILTDIFQSQTPKNLDAQFLITFRPLAPGSLPAILTQNEYSRRLKDMAQLQPGMDLYAAIPDTYNIVINTQHPLIVNLRDSSFNDLKAKIEPIQKEILDLNAQLDALSSSSDDEKKSESDKLQAQIAKLRDDQNDIISKYAATRPIAKQVVDLALLANGLLKGRDLTEFIERSVELL